MTTALLFVLNVSVKPEAKQAVVCLLSDLVDKANVTGCVDLHFKCH